MNTFLLYPDLSLGGVFVTHDFAQMLTNSLFILAVLCLNVVLSEWLVRRTFCRHFGTALLVIIVTAVSANVGLIPASGTPVPVYDAVFKYLAPIGIFWLLLRVNLRDVLQAGLPVLVMFLIGSVGTTVGVVVGMWAIGGPESIGVSYQHVGAMFVGTYTGGSVNFNALAFHYGVAKDGTLYTTSMVADNIATAVWMVATIAIPRTLMGVWPGRRAAALETPTPKSATDAAEDSETLDPLTLSLMLALGVGALLVSNLVTEALSEREIKIPSILIITTIALILAQIPAVSRLKGARLLGMFSVYVFLAVIGSQCDLLALGRVGGLAVTMMAFVTVVVAVHGAITFGAGAILRIDLDVVAVASQANIGGGTSALALARSLNRPDLVLPAILIGSLGLALGTYLGLFTAEWLLAAAPES